MTDMQKLGVIAVVVIACLIGLCKFIFRDTDMQADATTTQLQQVLAHAASLTTEQALVEGGKKDATPGWQLTSALYDKKLNEVCYTYSGTGHGISYERANMDSHTWIVYHSDGIKEISNGRTDFWEAGDDPCDRMKSTAKLLDKKAKIVDLLLTPAENACMDKVDRMPLATDKQYAAVRKATNVCFGQPTETK